MSTGSKGWSAKLTRTIVLKDGTTLATLADVRAFILKEPEHIQERGSWQRATELIILAAERDGSIEAATLQDRKSTRLNSRHCPISYAAFCLQHKHHDRHTHHPPA